MLVLSRHIEESILIGHDIEIKVVSISGGRVKLGIIAPREMQVHRKEVRESIERQAASHEQSEGQ